MTNKVIHEVFSILAEEVPRLQEPIVGRIARDRDPFTVLVSTMLSLRTKDSTTEAACARLFSLASTPEKLAALPIETIEAAIFPVGFYKTKAINIRRTSGILVERYGGRVPCDMNELLDLPGVGRKTANLVMILGFDEMGICVDTHVHRITNRWGYVATRTPEETEMRLREVLPREYWKDINNFLVPYGQYVCLPVSPYCSRCRIKGYCPRIGVKKSR
ncbi:MAG TPA: endonuclease III [Deltaproteobacteria bacterium]|nr:endonuclease III [Deltaproteobacteria bacterium]